MIHLKGFKTIKPYIIGTRYYYFLKGGLPEAPSGGGEKMMYIF
jgi:hypothetical protein